MRVAANILSSRSFRRIVHPKVATSSKTYGTLAVDGDFVHFPREREGNIYSDNWSLNEDGVVPVGDLFRNARVPILTQRLPSKIEAGKIALESPKYHGDYVALEAGDGISHDDFTEKLTEIQDHLSTGVELYVEDAFLGSFASSRLGVRVISDSPAAALILRSLLIRGPPRKTDHRARFNGWNFDERWIVKMPTWNGSTYDFVTEPTVSLPGERVVVVYHGGAGDTVALQFVEREGLLVGANVIVGSGAPIRGLVTALGQASSVMINTMHADCVALPSAVITKGKETTVIVGADESVLEAASSKNILYGAYDNVLHTEGVSAMWAGIIASSDKTNPIPAVVVGGKSATSLDPNNLSYPASHIVFYEAGAKTQKLTEEEAIQRIVDLSDESKKDIAAAIVKGVKLSLVGTAAEAIKI